MAQDAVAAIENQPAVTAAVERAAPRFNIAPNRKKPAAAQNTSSATTIETSELHRPNATALTTTVPGILSYHEKM